MKHRNLLLVFLTMFCTTIFSQKKSLKTSMIKESISIDGLLNEDSWKYAEQAHNFVMYSPDNGKHVDSLKRTIVKVLYDNNAIYIGAEMYDSNPEKILKEITQRDNFGTSDHFGVFINGNNDGQQDFRFFLSAAGVQMDCVTTDATGEDFSWDAIWAGNVQITDFGWTAEFRIPYAALRFSDADTQTWGLNFYRELRRENELYTWNFIDTSIQQEIMQTGTLTGIENIKTPTRLFLFPYAAYYVNKTPESTENSLKLGLDLKYGINDAFTLDAILVPDYGQTKFDAVELNLGPFEQQFNENRPFFTEGTELFNKGDLFYSRRIGGVPSLYVYPNNEDEVVENPATINLINAIKVSGRTDKGLGIGVLNAVTQVTKATVKNSVTGDVVRTVVEPLANYNIVVLDQRFQNSSATFVNTNVTRNGSFQDANVSAAILDYNTRNNTYNIYADFKYSIVNPTYSIDNKSGINTNLQFAETIGNYRFALGGNYVSKDFDSNDLGINYQTNFYNLFAKTSYRILNPTKTFNAFKMEGTIFTEFENSTGLIKEANAEVVFTTATLKNDYINFGLTTRALETYDFYEPRYEGRYVYIPRDLGSYIILRSNRNRKAAIDAQIQYKVTEEKGRDNTFLSLSPLYRFNNKFTATISASYILQRNNIGYIDDTYTDENSAFDIIFAQRDRKTYTLSSGAKYSLNKDMTFNLNGRYYWSYAENTSFYNLQENGQLNSISYSENRNSNFQTWNLDLSYNWWFAPGSQISILYRNQGDSFSRVIDKSLEANFSNLFKNQLEHNFSVSIRYFIDYNQAKNWL